ncbi:MAG: SpoIIE family protein phosphatase [Bacteroidales bacterium]|nr:SpoIIE family protein phosphatase [Bacteroidales bacterium]
MRKKGILIAYLTIIFLKLLSQDFGSPFITYYNFKDYKGHAQIWTITEDDRGIMYFGSTSEINVFDGENWNHIYLPQKSNVRSLLKAKSGVIYAGGSNEFGYLASDSLGKIIYVSLLPLLDTNNNQFADVWEIYETDEGIYFRSNQKLFRYNEQLNQIKVWNPKARFNPMSCIKGVGIIIRDGDDFFTIKNDIMVELPNPIKYYGQFLYRMFDYQDGKALCIGANNLYIYDFKAPSGTDPLTFFQTNVDNEFKNSHLYMGCSIGDTAFAITTLTKGVFIINKQGKLIERINKDDGLKYNHVWITFLSKNNNLWLGMDKGISKVDFASPIRFWHQNTGLDDALNSVYIYKNKLFVAGMTGVYKISLDSGKLSKFDGLTYNVWNFAKINATSENKEQLLIATSKGLYTTDGQNLRFLKEITYNYYAFQSKINPLIIYATTLNAIIAYKFENNELIPVDTIKFDGLSIKVIEKDNFVWISTFFKGIYRVKVKPDSNKIFEQNSLSKYDTLKGFYNNLQLKVHDIDDILLFSSTKGLFEFDATSDSVILSTRLNIKNDENSQFASPFSIYNNFFIINNEEVLQFKKSNSDYINHDTIKYKILTNKSKSNIFIDSSLNVYITGFDGLYFFKNSPQKDELLNKFPVYIRKVTINKDSTIFYGNYSDASGKITAVQNDFFTPTLKYIDNNIEFEYASPYFIADQKVKYSYMLKGFDTDWSDWSNEYKNKYTNLREGNYIFMVKAINAYEIESYVAEYKFKIRPPWHRTTFAYIGYIILFLLILYFSVKIFNRRLKRQNLRLERLVNKRTAEINQQKEEILTKNEELMQQQEEILAQRDELEVINKELEKLSIVASETENSVFIMDKNGNFVWANNAFERIYGYSYLEFIDLHKNIFNYLSDNELEQKIKQLVFTSKKPFRYNSPILSKNGKKIWLQTTFTPIVEFGGELRMVAAVESDISKLKEFENQIVSKNELIESSIRYAQTIQNSFLPPKADFDKYFDNFIIYRPKDVVSGDFYWFIETSEFIFTGVVDCTGHGVPGAFMSLIGSRILTNLVKEKKIYSPAQILTELDKEIIKTLHQKDNTNQDGMDVVLCRFDKKTAKETNITFSTAKRPIVYTKNGKLFREKGTSRSIGGYRLYFNKIDFIDFELTLNKNDQIFLFSDGYTDQNNVNRDKFKTTKLTKILQDFSNANNNFDELKNTLENELDKWQKGTTQRDDISFIGLKIR